MGGDGGEVEEDEGWPAKEFLNRDENDFFGGEEASGSPDGSPPLVGPVIGMLLSTRGVGRRGAQKTTRLRDPSSTELLGCQIRKFAAQ